MNRRHPVDQTDLQIEEVSPWRNEDYQGLDINWISSIGFGTYCLYRAIGEKEWHADSEAMDDKDDKDFGRVLLGLWMDSIEIDK